MERLQLPLPIWRVQYQLLGGHRRMQLIAVAVVVILGIAVVGLRRIMSDTDTREYVDGWIMFLAVIQPLILIMAGCNAVYRAILRDVNTGMLESHRLTPLSNVTCIAGYLLGATLQTFALCLIFLLFGSGLLLFDEQTIRHWMMGHVLILSGAIMLWSATAFFCLQGAKPRAPGGYLIAIGVLSSAVFFLPGAGVALGSYTVGAGFAVLTGNMQLPPASLVGVAAINLILASFWFHAAAAKFRRPDMPAFHALRGVLFFILWLSLAFGALLTVASSRLMPPRGTFTDQAPESQWIITFVASLLISIFPITGAVHCYRSVRQGARPRGWFDRVRPYKVALVCTIWLVAVPATLIVTVPTVLAAAGGPPIAIPYGQFVASDTQLGSLLLVCLLGMFTVMMVYDLALRVVRSPLLITCVIVVALWALPCLLDSMRATAVANFGDDLKYSWLMGCSPVGTMIALGTRLNIALLPGFSVQALILVTATLLSRVLGRKAKPILRR